MKRKLTTILCADVQRYSALMADDEVSTLATLNDYRDLMTDSFQRHDGRKVNTWGDAVIAEFASVVEAVQCAVEVQDAIAERNQDISADRQMWFRMGINLGDVMIDGTDLYGDGVNVASRLQDLADPGGVVVSSTVHNMVHRQMTLVFDSLGEAKVKNISDPITTFKVRLDGRNWSNDKDHKPNSKPGSSAPSGNQTDKPLSIFAKMAGRAEEGWHWLQEQPRSIKISAGAIGVLAGIGVAFDGLISPGFLILASPFALHIYLHVRRLRRLQSETDGARTGSTD